MTVRQWSQGELGDRPSALQRVAGTLVNIAVDYFVHTPGAISDKRPSDRVLHKAHYGFYDHDGGRA